jgi:thiamine pyrophosphokinase
MSSHHIVRENQEPALVIFDAHAIPFEKVQELLEWMPTIIVLHSQLETVLGWGIKVDVVLVPTGEEAIWIERIREQQPIRVISFHSTELPLVKAIEILEAQHIPAVNILESGEKALVLAATFKGDVDVFFDNKRWSRIKSGRFEKWVPKGATLFVLPTSIYAQMLYLQNGKLVAEKNGVVSLEAKEVFWVGEELG